ELVPIRSVPVDPAPESLPVPPEVLASQQKVVEALLFDESSDRQDQGWRGAVPARSARAYLAQVDAVVDEHDLAVEPHGQNLLQEIDVRPAAGHDRRGLLGAGHERPRRELVEIPRVPRETERDSRQAMRALR